MKTRLLNNIWLKIVSFILAFFVWLIVVNVNDPVITRTISNIPVSVSNTSYVESLGQSCKLVDGSDTVSVLVSGHRSTVETLTRDDVKAVADLTQIVSMESTPIMVPVTVTVARVSRENIVVSPGNIEIVLEEMQSQDFVVTPTAGESRPANKRYQVGELTASPESITVTGPSSLIRIIDRVTAPVDVTMLTSDTVLSSNLVIYDKNGAQFTDSQKESLRFTRTDGTAKVSVDLWRVMTDVALKAGYSGVPENGFRIGDITLTPSVISVAGTEEALAQIEEAGGIEIPEEMIEANGQNADFTVRIDLTQILPSGVKLADSASTTAIASVEVLPLDSKTFELPVTAITQQGLGEGLGLIFRTDKVRVRIQGSGENLADMTSEAIKLSIDLTGMPAGHYEDIVVTAQVPEGYTVVTPATVNFDIESIVDTTQSDSESSEP